MTDQDKALEEAKRLMAKMLAMPPRPHKPKQDSGVAGKPQATNSPRKPKGS